MTLHFHRVVRSTKRKFWQEQVAQLRCRDPRVFADRIQSCFRQPEQRLIPHESEWGSNSTPLGTCRRSPDVCAEWRNHFSPITSCQNADFDTVFAAAISDQFRACGAGQATGEFDALFTESIRALGQCHARTLPQVAMVSRIWSSSCTGGGALFWTSSTLVFAWNADLQHGSPARLFQCSNTEIAQLPTLSDRYLLHLALARCSNTSFVLTRLKWFLVGSRCACV